MGPSHSVARQLASLGSVFTRSDEGAGGSEAWQSRDRSASSIWHTAYATSEHDARAARNDKNKSVNDSLWTEAPISSQSSSNAPDAAPELRQSSFALASHPEQTAAAATTNETDDDDASAVLVPKSTPRRSRSQSGSGGEQFTDNEGDVKWIKTHEGWVRIKAKTRPKPRLTPRPGC